MMLALTTGLVVLTSGPTAPPKVSMMIENYYWKVPIGQERRFKEERGDWVISVLLSREAEDYAPRFGWAKEKPGWGRSPVLRSKTSIKRVDLIYKGNHVIIRSGLQNLYNMDWVRFEVVPGGLNMSMDIEAYSDESQAFEAFVTYRREGIKRIVRDAIEDELVETSSFRPINWPSVF